MSYLSNVLWLLPAVVGMLAWIGPYVDYLRSGWKIRYLEELPADGPKPLPRLSVIVPALNEETTIEPAMRSLLAIDYPDLEIIAVDDRSTDRTGEILDRLASEDGRLRVAHIQVLPAGWLGKNHAMQKGGETATGEFLLFTDADVHFQRSALARAVRFVVENDLDHLVVLPHVVLRGVWETVCVWFFGVIFTLKFRPWRVHDPKSRYYSGVGAFNLVRASTYRRAGGHAMLPLEVGDDVKLGKLLKQCGGRPEMIVSDSVVSVRWVEGVRGLVLGLTKNMYAGLDFSPLKVVGATVGLALLAIWPTVGLFFGPPAARGLCLATLGVIFWSASLGRPYRAASPLYALGFPFAALVVIYIMWRSMFFTHRQGGIVWRGTLYPLDELRKGLV